jgi:hypothetical protein
MTNQTEFPRTQVGGVSLPRLIIGTNWFLGYSHTSLAKDRFIKDFQTRERISAVLRAFLEFGVDAVMGPLSQQLEDSIQEAEQRAGRHLIRMYTPAFDLGPAARAIDLGPAVPPPSSAPAALDQCMKWGATYCLPHQCVVDALVDRRAGLIRDLDQYTRLIRERGMIPGLSTHMPETVVYADKMGADVATYIQIYNAAGFLMQMETDWVMRIIHEAQKPVITIKPLAAGRLPPVVALAFVWSTLREQDLVTVGATTPDEAREVVELSLDFLNRRLPTNDLQTTRSKHSLR